MWRWLSHWLGSLGDSGYWVVRERLVVSWRRGAAATQRKRERRKDAERRIGRRWKGRVRAGRWPGGLGAASWSQLARLARGEG